jgi:hypothetical protein
MSWSQAFARQASSDFDARETLLRDTSLPQCHQLHYLQMAMEKAAKAHLLTDPNVDPYAVQSSHAYIAKVIPIIVKDGLGRAGGKKDGWVMEAVHKLAERISRLHPQIDRQAMPANCEYPWKNARGEIVAPVDFDFGMNFHAEPVARTMLKEVRARVRALATSGTGA